MLRLDALKKTPTQVSIRAGKLEFLRSNSTAREWRDLYRTILAMSWLRFAVATMAIYVGINLSFATLYWLSDGCIAEMQSGSFLNAFFFSVETLSTVGYGQLYPVTVYAHVITTLEIVVGMFFTAVITGLIFVRFSRPAARLLFSDSMVICPYDGRPSLQIRVANAQHQPMVEAQFRLMLIRKEDVAEEEEVRRFYTLKLEYEHLIMFPSALTIRHVIDESSPLHGLTLADLERTSARFMMSIVCIDTVIQAPVQSQADYLWNDVRFAHRFVEIYHELDDGRLEVDYGLIHETEAVD